MAKVPLSAKSKYKNGFYIPKNPEKYVGDVKNIIYRSSWEKRVCEWFDTTSAIVHWNSEGLIVDYFYPQSGKFHKYHIDFIASIKNRHGEVNKYAIEIKPAKEKVLPSTKDKKRFAIEMLTYTKNQAKWIAAKTFCAQHGMQFIVLDEYDLGIKQRPKK